MYNWLNKNIWCIEEQANNTTSCKKPIYIYSPLPSCQHVDTRYENIKGGSPRTNGSNSNSNFATP